MAHQFGCSARGLRVRPDTDDELVGLVRNHAEEVHDTSVSPPDVRAGWGDVSLEADD